MIHFCTRKCFTLVWGFRGTFLIIFIALYLCSDLIMKDMGPHFWGTEWRTMWHIQLFEINVTWNHVTLIVWQGVPCIWGKLISSFFRSLPHLRKTLPHTPTPSPQVRVLFRGIVMRITQMPWGETFLRGSVNLCLNTISSSAKHFT